MQTVVTIEISGCLSSRTLESAPPSARSVSGCCLTSGSMSRVRRYGDRSHRGHDRLRGVCQLVALVAQQRNYKTLERLCTAIADRIIEDFDGEAVWVKAAKPEPPIPLPVEEVSVEVWRELPADIW